VITNDIDWSLIITGIWIGVAIIVIDEILARTTKHTRVPPLAVGLGIYLPTVSTLMVVVGSIVGWYFDRRADRSAKPESTKQLGVLLASGLIVGESIVGVLIAALVAFADKLGFSNQQAPLSLVGPGFAGAAQWIGGIAFAAIVFIMYRWVARMANRLPGKS
jgi:uncharacterized oligopeptide transporter (OPT) family protein